MNSELKAILDLGFDAYSAGESAFQKQDFVSAIIPKLYKVASDIPAVAANYSLLQGQIDSLKNAAEEADMAAYMAAKFSHASAKQQAILSAMLKLIIDIVQDSIALDAAFKM